MILWSVAAVRWGIFSGDSRKKPWTPDACLPVSLSSVETSQSQVDSYRISFMKNFSRGIHFWAWLIRSAKRHQREAKKCQEMKKYWNGFRKKNMDR